MPAPAQPLAVPTATLGISEARRQFCGLVADVVRSGEPTIVTNNGVQVAAIVPIAALEDLAARQPRAR